MNDADKSFFAKNGMKLTKQRMLVLTILRELNTPASAEDIYLLAIKLQPTLNLSTIYRILELFCSKNIAIKNVLLETQKAVYEINTHTHKHYMTCVKCQAMIPLENCPCSLIEKAVAQNSDFEILDHRLEILGYCSHCK